ncbi:MAG: mechanosensitive ion channel family protein [Acidiferrobacter sp.]
MAKNGSPEKFQIRRVVRALPWTTALWVALAVGLLFVVDYAQQHYKLPLEEVSILRTLIVVLAGLRVIHNIDGAMARHRARNLEAMVRSRQAFAFAWQDSVTGIYLIRLLLYAGLALLAIFVVGGTFSGVLVGGTLISVTLGVAGQSFFGNFFGGLAVALFKPFELGDHVQIVAWQFPMMPETYPHQLRAQGYRGVIRDINLFYSEMRLDDGQLFRVPNGVVITGGLIRSVPHEWARIVFRFDIAVPADPAATVRALEEAAARHFRPRPEDPIPEPSSETQGLAVSVAPPFGWDPPVVLMVDISLTALSIEVRASVPQRLRDHAKAEFFANILSIVYPSKVC